MSVADILEQKGYTVFTVREDAPLTEIVGELAARHIGVLVVTNDRGEIAGIVSERDVIRELARDARSTTKTAAQIMTRTVCKCSPDDSESDVMERMGKAGVRHLPVEHNGRLLGLISARDVLAMRIQKLDALMKDVRTEAARRG